MNTVKVLMFLFILLFMSNGMYKGSIDRDQCFSHQTPYNIYVIEEKLNYYYALLFLQDHPIKDNQNLINTLIQIESPTKEPIKIISQNLQDINIKNNILELRTYKQIQTPNDIQAVAFYDYLVELKERLHILEKQIDQLLSSLKQFSNSIQLVIDDYNKIIKKLDIVEAYSKNQIVKEIKQLEEDYIICNHRPFRKPHLHYQVLDRIKKKFKNQKQKKLFKQISHFEEQPVLLEVKPSWQFEQKPPIQKDACKVYKLENEYIEVLKIQETLIYISNQQSKTNQAIQKLAQFQNQFAAQSEIIKNNLKNVQLYNIMTTHVHISNKRESSKRESTKDDQLQKLQQLFDDLYGFESQKNFLNENISNLKKLLDLREMKIDEIVQLNNKINLIKDNYYYQPDQIYNILQQYDRDYKICGGSQKFELISDIKLPANKQLQKQNNVVEIIPPIKQEQCSTQIKILQDNLYQTIKYKILSQAKNFYDDIIKDWDRFKYSKNMRYRNERPLEYFLNQFDSKPIKELSIYSQNYKPDDSQAVDAYDALIILNNKLLLWKSYFDSAKSTLGDLVQDYRRISENISELKQKIDQLQNKVDHYRIVNQQVREQEYVEQLRDYKICTGKEFLKEKNIIIDLNLLLEHQKKNKIFISINKIKHKTAKKSKKNNKFKSQILQQLNTNEFEAQLTGLLYTAIDWKYYDYPEITLDECKVELNMIKEDILQFLKIKILIEYKTKSQKEYNQLLNNFLELEDRFLESADYVKEFQQALKLDSRVVDLSFNFPDSNDQITKTFGDLLYFNKKLVQWRNAQINTKTLSTITKDDFSAVRFNQFYLNEYLDKHFNYQLDDVDKELKQLYRDYQKCTGKQYQLESEENKKIKQSLLEVKQIKKNRQKGKKPKRQ